MVLASRVRIEKSGSPTFFPSQHISTLPELSFKLISLMLELQEAIYYGHHYKLLRCHLTVITLPP